MTDENKENIGKEENKKKNWFKNVGFKPNLVLVFLLFMFFFMPFPELKNKIFYIQNKIFNEKRYEYSQIIKEGEWETINNTGIIPREFPAAHLLPDGNILIIGGSSDSMRYTGNIYNQTKEVPDIAEIYNPTTREIIKKIPLKDKRYSLFSSVSLKNGDVFISGGTDYNYSPPNISNTAKIFDAQKYTFKDVKPMVYKTAKHKLILLDNGNVLILHCLSNYGKREGFNYQIYDPNRNEYYFTKNTPYATWGKNEWMKLNNGNIFIYSGRSYIYDVKKNAFEKTTKNFPIGNAFIPINNNEYLNLNYNGTNTIGYVFKIKEQQKIPVKNTINRVWNYPYEKPILVTLNNENVLILGINEYKLKDKRIKSYKNTAYIYNKKKNIFYEIYPPTYSFASKPAIVKLKNGNIMFIGGSLMNGIQIYKY